MTDIWKDPDPSRQPEENGDSMQFPDVSFDSSSKETETASAQADTFDSSAEPVQPQSPDGPSAGTQAPPPAPEDVFSHSEAAQASQEPYRRTPDFYSGSSYHDTTQAGSPAGGRYPYEPQNAGGGFPPQPPVYSPTGGWQQPPVPPPPPQKAGGRQKLFLGLIGALAVVLTVSFVGWGLWSSAFGDPDKAPFAGLPTSSPAPSSGENSSEGEEPTPSQQPEISLGQGGTIEIQDIPSGEPLTAKEVYKKVSPSVVGIVATVTDANGNESSDEGSGIVATSDGYIITNSHVVNDSRTTKVKVVTKDDQEYPGVVVGYDRTTDLAVVKIEAKGLTPAEFGNADQMEIGDVVLAIGNPGGLEFASSMTQGIISALDRTLGSNSQNGMTYIQTDAAINPGNSGGALVNSYGQVIGINSSKLVAEDFEGMGFAIPVSKAQDILNSLMNVGYVQGRTRLGIMGRDITEQEAQFYEVPSGFLIMEIDEDSDIDEAGGKVQDIICGINGQEVTGLSDISDLLLDYSPGDKITLNLYRMSGGAQGNGEKLDITITLLEDKGETQNR